MGALDDTLGAFMIGAVGSAILYGITCVQTWYHYAHYPLDPWYIKLLVAGVFVLATSHQALITHTVYTYLITNFGIQGALGDVVWSLIVSSFFNAFIAFIVQSFLAMRIYRLSNKNWLATGSVMTLVIGEFVSVLACAIDALHLQTFTQMATIMPLSMSVIAVATAGNVLITVLLCPLLQMSRTDLRRSDKIDDKLIVFGVNTGLLTSICAVALLVSVSAWPSTFIYITFYFFLGQLYCSSLLATLNMRKAVTSKSPSGNDDSSLFHQWVQQKMSRSMTRSAAKHVPNNIPVRIGTTQAHIRDGFPVPSGDVKSPEVV